MMGFCNGGQRVDTVQVKPQSPDLKRRTSNCCYLASWLAYPPPTWEIEGLRPARKKASRDSVTIASIYSKKKKKRFDPLLIFYVWPLTKILSVYNFNGLFI